MFAMNQGFNASDPSAQVPNNLLAHVHLVSSYRFPPSPTLQPAQALESLIKAPQIVKDTASVAWTFFPSPPPDGTVLLTWQPPRMGTHFASDGLVWADPETAYEMNIRNYSLQVLVHNSGYVYPQEPVSSHARFRYRILSGPGIFDHNLWLVHYKVAEPNNRIPSVSVPPSREVMAQLQMRSQLMSAGQLVRKEFMLDDRSNWPKVEFGQTARAQPAYYNPMQPGRPFPNQPPPAKRQRLPPQQQTRPPPSGAMVVDTSLEDEENATQDTFDFMTPREISLSRYKQHHQWMEEIFSSPHPIGSIVPTDLGLGLMGELAHLTENILDAPGGGNVEDESYQVKTYYKLTPELLAEFERRVSAHTTKEQAELDKMKAAHAKKVTSLKRSRTYVKAERRLRDASRAPASDGDEGGDGQLDGVVRDLEKSVGITFGTKKLVTCVEKGGYIEVQQPQSEKPQANGDRSSQADGNGASNAAEGDNTAASLLDQFGSGSLGGTPGANLSAPQMSQPQSQSQSAVATPSAPITDSNQPSAFDEQAANIETNAGADLLNLDVEMSGMANSGEKNGDEWVMVDNQGSENIDQSVANSTQPQQPGASTGAPSAETSTLPTSGIDTGTLFDTEEFGSFDPLDTAGDALADYTNVGDSIDLGMEEDSAFGDAFHGTQMHSEEGDGV